MIHTDSKRKFAVYSRLICIMLIFKEAPCWMIWSTLFTFSGCELQRKTTKRNKQFLTRPNLACSVAKPDHRFFRFWCSTKPFQVKIDIKNHLNERTWKVRSNLELETTKHIKNCIFLPKTDSTSKFVTKETLLLLPQTPWQSMRWLNSPISDLILVK